MATMNLLANDLAEAQFVNVEALGQAKTHIEETVVDAFHADANGPGILLASRLGIAGHGQAFGLFGGSGTGGQGSFRAAHDGPPGALLCSAVCAEASMSSSAN